MKMIIKNKENSNEPYLVKMVRWKPKNLRARSQKIAPNISKLDHLKKFIPARMWGWIESERILVRIYM